MLPVDRDELFEIASDAKASGAVLRTLSLERIADALAIASQRIASDVSQGIRNKLSGSTGLSEPMIDWALRTSVPQGGQDFFLQMERVLVQPPLPTAMSLPARLLIVWLSGNVFTASLRSLFVPLLLRVPVIAKVSSRDLLFPSFIKRHLDDVDKEVGAALKVVSVPRDRSDCEEVLLSQADVVSVYGSDTTIAELRARVPATTHLIAHGHGLGAVYVAPNAFAASESSFERAVDDVALDVAAYDQRGCLSPHAVWIDVDAGLSAREFGERLARRGLQEIAHVLPRGAMPLEVGAAQVQWRAVGAARGELFEGDGYSVSYEGSGAFRISPGYRNVSVLECRGVNDFIKRVSPLGVHLKCVGVVGEVQDLQLPSPLAPRVCPVGSMQTPPFLGLADGEPLSSGLIRWREVDFRRQ